MRYFRPCFAFFAALLVAGALTGCSGVATTTHASDPDASRVPEWAIDAVWYQIFPERFRNGDPTNDPIHASLETYEPIPESWHLRRWTSDWYERDAWEREMGDHFYDNGVFHRRYGGDLQGVIDKLDYLQDLGINALYFNPVFYARSRHKYDGSSFHHVDPYFGPDPEGDLAMIEAENALDPNSWVWTSADLLFLDLLDAANTRGMRVIIDGVFNHTGKDFFAMKNLRELQQDSPYRDWYVVNSWRDPNDPDSRFTYQGWWGYDTLPEFAEVENDLAPGPKEYVFNATRRWMRPVVDGQARRGIDGWRLDVANEVPDGFWVDWHTLVRELNPEAYTVAEIWDAASDYLDRTGFGATMNYHAFAYPVKGYLIDNSLSPSGFAEMLEERKGDYSERIRFALQNLIDSHDTDRVASMIVNQGRTDYLNASRFDYDVSERVSPRWGQEYDVRKPNATEWQIQRLMALFQMTAVGAPMIYYGTEAGMWGADDPDDRKPMIWGDLRYDVERSHPFGRSRPADVVAFDSTLHAYYRQIIGLRNENAPLRRGSFDVVTADDATSVLAFTREFQGERLLVVLNRGEAQAQVQVPSGSYEVIAVSYGQPADVGVSDGVVGMPALTGAVLRAR
jgi:cyclomaltodextrinase / maltogenic alpha-amylase / neopullulanase